MKFLPFCLFSALLMTAPLQAADLLDANDIKKELQTFRKKICLQSTPKLPLVIKKQYTHILQTIDKRIRYIEDYQAKKCSNDYIEGLLESRLGGGVSYIVALSKIATSGKIPALESIVNKPAIFSEVDLENYLLVAQLIKYFYQQISPQDLTEKTKIYLSISKTLWGYLQNKSTLICPTTGDLWEEASLYTQYTKNNILPENEFPLPKE
jgi:hypothetical protein